MAEVTSELPRLPTGSQATGAGGRVGFPAKICKRTRILPISSKPYSVHFVHSAIGNKMKFRSFQKRDSSQKYTDTVYSECSYSGIVPKERAHCFTECFLARLRAHATLLRKHFFCFRETKNEKIFGNIKKIKKTVSKSQKIRPLLEREDLKVLKVEYLWKSSYLFTYEFNASYSVIRRCTSSNVF